MALKKDARSAMKFVNEHEDKKCVCEYCWKRCDNASMLSRHISHAKSCSEHYGQEFIQSMRTELRYKTRSKWYLSNKDKVKQKNKKSYYVPKSKRHSPAGRVFENIFHDIFKEFTSDINDQIEEYFKDKLNFVTSDDIENALDKTFDFTDTSLFGLFEAVKEEDNEEANLNIYFTRLEKKFQSTLLDSVDVTEKFWDKKDKLSKIGNELWNFSSNRAFYGFYREDEFKSLIKCSEDIALDEIFLNLMDTENYFKEDISDSDLQRNMEQIFSSLSEKETLKKLEEDGTLSELKVLMEDIIKKKVYTDEGFKFLVKRF